MPVRVLITLTSRQPLLLPSLEPSTSVLLLNNTYSLLSSTLTTAPKNFSLGLMDSSLKMNIDTDTQWSYWEGIKNFEKKYHDYLQSQIGNPDGPDKPNKKCYDVSAPLQLINLFCILLCNIYMC